MGELIRSKDWSETPLGPMEQWPQTLLANLATILESPFPLQICWGRELTILYNDAFITILGAKHPALGKCLLDVWFETRESIEPLIEKAFAGEMVHVEKGSLRSGARDCDREKFLDNGMNGYVTKPVDFRELARVIAKVLNLQEGGHSSKNGS